MAAFLACLLLERASAGASIRGLWEASATMVACLNGAHFAATSIRLYRDPQAMRQFPVTAGVVPVLVLAGVAASLRWPQAVAPYFVKLFLLWSPYHYSGQTLGLSALYCRRAGVKLEPAERAALACFVYGIVLAAAAAAESSLNRFNFSGIAYPSLGLPSWVSAVSLAGMWAGGAAFLFLAARRLRGGQALPAIVFLPPLAQLVWFILGPSSPLFYSMVPMFHGMQYLLVAWFLNLQQRRAQGERLSVAGAGLETARWGAWTQAGSWGLFWALPKLVSVGWGIDYLFVAPLFSAGVQLHHFFVDGVIWRLRSPRLSQALTAPLSEAVG